LKALIDQLSAVVDKAVETFQKIKALVKALRSEVMPPIQAFMDKLKELQTLFSTGVQLLQSILHQGTGALDAIPATGLPKMLVEPAISSIQIALDAALPQIDAGAKQ